MHPDRPPSPEDPTVSIVHRPASSALYDPDPDYVEASVTPIAPSPVEAFLTPWGIGSIFIFLLANSLLTWSQLMSPAPENSIGETPAPAKTAKTTTINLDTLVNVAAPVKAPVTPGSLPVAPTVPVTTAPISSIPTPPPQPVIRPTQPTGNLAGALLSPLSPSLQPALMPAHTLSVSQIRQSLPAPSVPPSPPAPIVSIDPPKPPSVVSQNSPPSPALLNERMVDELRRREEAATNRSFFQREKARRMEIQKQREASELQRQLPPRPTTETRSSVDSPPRPTAPGTIIIDRSGGSVNQ